MTSSAAPADTDDRCPAATRRALTALLLLGAALFLAFLFAGSARAEQSGGPPPSPVAALTRHLPALPGQPEPGQPESGQQRSGQEESRQQPGQPGQPGQPEPGYHQSRQQEPGGAPDLAAERAPVVPAAVDVTVRPSPPAGDRAPEQAAGEVPDQAAERAGEQPPAGASLDGIGSAAGSAPRAIEPVVRGVAAHLPVVRATLPPFSQPPGQDRAGHGHGKGNGHGNGHGRGGSAEDRGTGISGGPDREAAGTATPERDERADASGFGPSAPSAAPPAAAAAPTGASTAPSPPSPATFRPDDAAPGDDGPSPSPGPHHTADLGRSACDHTPRGVDQPTALPSGHPLLSGEDQLPTGPDHPLRDRPYGVLVLPG
ncbi:hypothetical protein [Streptomyces specialis]|uniref:hypothetical protein n=1 Tax=Streptomyces specialis TaxID=498367 RepID=UPI00073EC23C|nr:hypothetical protein [Streptomyces specialis]